MKQNILIILIVMFFVTLIMPIIKKVAVHVNALDIPNERKVHKKSMPRLGGLGIFFGLLIGYMIFAEENTIMNSILISSFIIVITGMIDDINPIKARYKFLAQLIAACVIVFYGDIVLDHTTIFGLNINFSYFSIPITLFFILGCINCINLIDGMDGLAGGISAIYFLTIGIICYLSGGFELQSTLCFIMLGSCLGFLFHNFYPARIFMGDSGSMLLGLIISVVALLGFKAATLSSLIIPLLVLAIPIFDTIFAIIRRKLKKQSISKADKFHIHHQLLSRTSSQRKTVIIIYIIDLMFAFASITFALKHYNLSYIMYGIILVLALIFIFKTNIIYDFKSKKNKK